MPNRQLLMERPYRCRHKEYYMKVQVGESLFPHQGDSAETLIEQASAAIT